MQKGIRTDKDISLPAQFTQSGRQIDRIARYPMGAVVDVQIPQDH